MRNFTDRILSAVLLFSVFTIRPIDGIGQSAWGFQQYLSFGYNLGMGGFSPATLNNSGMSHLSRTPFFSFGGIYHVDGHITPAIAGNTSFGTHVGSLWLSENKNNFFSIETEFQDNKAAYAFKTPFDILLPTNSKTNFSIWNETDNYLRCSGAFQYGHYLENMDVYLYIRTSLGETFFHRNTFHHSELNYIEDWTVNGSGLKTKNASTTKNSPMLGVEIGIKKITYTEGASGFDIGLVYYAPFATNTFRQDFEFFKDGNLVGKSSIVYNGGSLMLNVRHTFCYRIKKDAPDEKSLIE